jgi:hypothetical protein
MHLFRQQKLTPEILPGMAVTSPKLEIMHIFGLIPAFRVSMLESKAHSVRSIPVQYGAVFM